MASSRRARLVVFTLLILGALGVGVFLVAKGGSVSSPGPLAKVHAHLDADAGCKLCHARGTGITGGLETPAQLCLDCHTPLAARIDAGKGYHQHVEREDCRRCHADHLGLQNALISWPEPERPFALTPKGKAEPKQFPHAEGAGFPLRGAHQKIACEGCHKPALEVDPALFTWESEQAKQAQAESPQWDKGLDSYLGLDRECGSCHQDAHVPSQGSDCNRCHGEESWKPALDFVHEPPRTRYPLEGKHKDVKCEECHLVKQEAQPAPVKRKGLPDFAQVIAKEKPARYRGVGFGTTEFKVKDEVLPDTCKVCHANPHRSPSQAFLRCEDCHTPAGWTPMAPGSAFDHKKTGFALEGGHEQVSCAKCHGEKQGQQVLAAAKRETCLECHQKDDPHKGAFEREMALAKDQNCALCHSVKSWKPDTYDRAEHGKKALALIEGHAIKCEDCHGQGPIEASCALTKDGKRACTESPPFQRLPARGGAPVGELEKSCQGCHWNPHPTNQSLFQDCASCHSFKAWHLAELDMAGHEKLGFPVRGAHVKNFDKCDGCHGGRLPGGGLRQVALSDWKDKGCYACHADDDAHKGQLKTNCQSCHTEEKWEPSTYDLARHQKNRFPLQAAHAAVPCEVCHVRDANKVAKYTWQSLGCTSCHKDDATRAHGAQFKGQDCQECHTELTWAPSKFDKPTHLRVARFALEGAHDTACSACHQPIGGSKVVRYEGIPTQCAGCHEDPHLGQFAGRWGDGCSGCHKLEAWTPSTFDHDRARFPLKGAHAAIPCETCHVKIARTFDGQTRQVAHYYPIEERACDDCHQNPHAREGQPQPR